MEAGMRKAISHLAAAAATQIEVQRARLAFVKEYHVCPLCGLSLVRRQGWFKSRRDKECPSCKKKYYIGLYGAWEQT